MIHRLILLCLLSSCHASPIPGYLQSCAPDVPVPAASPAKSLKDVESLEIRVELAREKERARGDDCANKLAQLNSWVTSH